MPTTPDRVARRRLAALVLAAVAVTVGLAPAASAVPPRQPHPVVLVALPDLRWSDLVAMPHLSALFARGSVGELSVRSEGHATRCGDALLELSAGTRVPSGVTPCDIDEAKLAQLRERYRHSRYGARIGLLGDELGSIAAPGSSASVVLSTSAGLAPRPVGMPAPALGFPRLSVMVIERFYTAADRRTAGSAIDSGLASTLQKVPADAVVIVAGISDGPTGGPRLHPIVITGPGWPHRELTSPSTGRAPYVQLFDITATLLSLEGVTHPPATVSGRAVHPSSSSVRSMSTYLDLDTHARRALDVGHPTFTGLSVALIVVLLILLWRPVLAGRAASLLVFAPLATWLVQVLPWWRGSLAVYIGFVVAVSVLGSVAIWLIGRRSSRAALLVGPAVTAGVLLVDQLIGGPLQISAPFGDNPLVAGRFHGMGNIDFAVTMAAAILCLAAIASGRARRSALLTVAAGGVVLLVVDGAPSLGDDIGGVLALVPTLALLAALVARVRLTVRRVLPVLAAAIVVGTGVALLDYSRPEDKRTHAGRFVEDVIKGEATRTLHRKLDAVLGSFTNPVVTGLVVLAVIVVLLARRRPDLALTSAPLVAAAGAVAVLAVLGSLLNDSGVFVAAAALVAFVPAVVPSVVAARPAEPDVRDTRSL